MKDNYTLRIQDALDQTSGIVLINKTLKRVIRTGRKLTKVKGYCWQIVRSDGVTIAQSKEFKS